MRRIEHTSQFKRDYKREAKGQHRATLDAELMPVLRALACDQPLEPRHRDHALTGDWVCDHIPSRPIQIPATATNPSRLE
ncbi:MAG: type II toxin-antitoxin system YafQ family toxin [Candidatus Thiodiazotropha sp. (ex Dulcina madagascariensis)]|nr:type II toxin-antitoxin system YafQ family toxin [Candidatus Thiodiazotropha sp. (ex Dulcina madagascariensis)]MCU7928860.1 type II toxin-antitoxin system YafQ family toxin [Candidatus Thiodiazotropha sp. (ex Dulcina madagascariensis)]